MPEDKDKNATIGCPACGNEFLMTLKIRYVAPKRRGRLSAWLFRAPRQEEACMELKCNVCGYAVRVPPLYLREPEPAPRGKENEDA